METDRNGNLWAWWGAKGPGAVVTGSHLDSVPDGGAFDGDSMRSFLGWAGGEFSRIDAFEPDPATFARLEGFVATLPQRDRIRLHHAAIADRAGTIGFVKKLPALRTFGSSGAAAGACALGAPPAVEEIRARTVPTSTVSSSSTNTSTR